MANFLLYKFDLNWWDNRKGLYYCKVIIAHISAQYKSGVYCHPNYTHERTLWSYSEKIWFEDTDTGEVYIVKDRYCPVSRDAINNCEELRKEFILIKLSAKEI